MITHWLPFVYNSVPTMFYQWGQQRAIVLPTAAWLVPKVWFGDPPGFHGWFITAWYIHGWFPKCGWGPLGVPTGFQRGSMAGSQSVVRGPLGVPEGFLGPWPQTGTTSRDPWRYDCGPGDMALENQTGHRSAPVRLWGLGLGLQSSQGPPGVPGTPGDHRWTIGFVGSHPCFKLSQHGTNTSN